MIVIGMIGMGTTATAGEIKAKAGDPVVTEKTIEAQTHQTFTGMVNKTGKQIILSTDKKTYILGGSGLEKIIGKKVSITGTLLKGDTIDTIIVEKARLIS
ncbi:MAG: hypothetical protein JEZ12_04080 [Desulfobacterium sp.]|nr:hypothetical protein [Desulfobacterium sp.]